MKKIIYLFGAGATQAVIKSFDPSRSLMTQDIVNEIQCLCKHNKPFEDKIWNELISIKDIEHFISVLESQQYVGESNMIRKFYMKALINLVDPISKALSYKNLYSVLIDLHKNVKGLDEELLCLITLNYEDLLEQTIKKYHDYSVDYSLFLNCNKNPSINVLKLHGSFNWENARPVKIKTMSLRNSKKALWVPPGVDKRKENYPFNLLWGKALEYLMKCDVLRIIGCSLSRNDWSLIPILYTIQKFRTTGSPLEIEIINYPSTYESIKDNYGYLSIKSILEIPEFIGYFKKQLNKSNPSALIKEIKAKYESKDKSNPFYDWLDSKIDYLVSQKLDISTDKNIVNNFYYKI
jgi:hypothetical protein